MSTHKAYEQPYENYWHILYPRYADPDSGAYWYPSKPSVLAMSL
jgi:hypothetical protein